MRRHRQAKIVAPLGPACFDDVTISALFEADGDVFCFSFSHGRSAQHREHHDLVRLTEQKTVVSRRFQ